jgi:L-ascorbate metabolism protein UlaG (beta-lactamase superfamily)
MAKLIAIYAGYGDTLLLQKPAVVDPVSGQPQHKYWLIDGGPITSASGDNPEQGTRNAYQQYLKLALKRFCASRTDPNHLYQIDLLEGIIVSHPHTDHINGELFPRSETDDESHILTPMSIQVSSNS